MNDYARIAEVIQYLDENHEAQPSLEELASSIGLSESHFHRIFRRWVGATPKEFLQCLTVEHAKEKLRQSASVLDAALDSGLSGPGRLHDLFVKLEAASPGEFKNRGTGMQIRWGEMDSPFGKCVIAWSKRGICHLSFPPLKMESETYPGEFLADWSAAEFLRDDDGAETFGGRIFHPSNSEESDLRVLVRATSFQIKVWRALLRIPEGSVSSYGEIARSIGSPGAARAVGSACGANQIGYLIPCHRVIRESGIVRNYRWGTPRKKAMLAWESCR